MVTLRANWSNYWTSWRLRRSQRKTARLIQQEQLLLLSLDLVRLEQKAQEEQTQLLLLMQQEKMESRQFRLKGILPPAESPDPTLEWLLPSRPE